ncbi:MAG TPA: tetratricopeptide repeat protein [Oculatellaceae cyanobacterium]
MQDLQEQHLKAKLTKARSKYDEDHPTVALLYMDLGDFYELEGKFSEAEREYKRAAKIFEELGLDHELLLALAIKSAAEMARIQNKIGAARALKQKARLLVKEYCDRDFGCDDDPAA